MEGTSLFIKELQEEYSVKKPDNIYAYHNARLLLKIYSKAVWRIRESLDELDQECYDSDKKHLFDLINSLIDVDTQMDKARFERRMQSVEESKSLIELVDRALMKLRTYPQSGERHFQILSKVYLENGSTQCSEEDLCEALHISRSTLYREKRNAVTMLGVVLWGVVLPDILKAMKKVGT